MEDSDRIAQSVRSIKGIVKVFVLDAATSFQLLDIEIQAEKKAFMGMGLCYNSGIREVLSCPVVITGITSEDFDWGCQSHIILKKEDEIVGEEVRNPERIKDLEQRKDVCFLHKNFVIYKDKINFPGDIVQKKCVFELPALTGRELIPDLLEAEGCVLCFPSVTGDIFLKKTYYEGIDERGTGTVLFGFKEAL